MTRLNHCARSRIQIMVGSTSTSMTTLVMTASSSVISMRGQQRRRARVGDDLRPGATPTRCPSLVPSSENLTMASNGSRKNRPKIVNATYLKTFSRLRWLARRPPGRLAAAGRPARSAPGRPAGYRCHRAARRCSRKYPVMTMTTTTIMPKRERVALDGRWPDRPR